MSFFPDRPSEVLRHPQKTLGSMWSLWSGWIWGREPNHHLTLATIIKATKSKVGVLRSRTVPELCVLHSPYLCSVNGDTTFIASKQKSNKTQFPQHKLWLFRIVLVEYSEHTQLYFAFFPTHLVHSFDLHWFESNPQFSSSSDVCFKALRAQKG